MRLALILSAVLVFATDQACKALVREKIPAGGSIPVVPGKFHLTHVRNHGAANGLFARRPRTLMFFTWAAVAGEVNIFFDLCKNYRGDKLAWVFFALNIGGGASNVYDRLTGRPTVDYLQICPNRRSPAFNIADIFILAGSFGLLILAVKRLFSRTA
ncbi:MAG: signal peptidase II [Defluviitaleaceae bacterium]|nr:signal peptidase II [Defluviitaleaceae bacterium]